MIQKALDMGFATLGRQWFDTDSGRQGMEFVNV
jgi:hypothetical protein